MESAPTARRAHWQQYRWTPGLRRGFITTYVLYGLLLLILLLQAVDAAQSHLGVVALLPLALAVVLAFYLTRAAYRQVWLQRHNSNSGLVRPIGERIWDTVNSNHVLTEAERPGAQAGVDKALWGPSRLFVNLVVPGLSAVWLVDHLVRGRAQHTPVQTAVLVLALIFVLSAGWGFVMQARLRKWMALNGLSRK